MKRAFTLIELLMVVAIMGIVGSAAIGGYYAMSRGMEDRGALTVAEGLFAAAAQRAEIDSCRTYVYCYDQILVAESEDEPMVARGTAVAIRPAGRFTKVLSNKYLIDEFGELEQQYESTVDEDDEDSDLTKSTEVKGLPRRIWKINSSSVQPAYVKDGVVYKPEGNVTLLNAPSDGSLEIPLYAWELDSGASFTAMKDEYGMEIAVVELPNGYIFGSSKPNGQVGKMVNATSYTLNGENGNQVSEPAVSVYAIRPNGKVESVGSISAAAKQVGR